MNFQVNFSCFIIKKLFNKTSLISTKLATQVTFQ